MGGEAGLGQGPVLHGSAQPPGGLMGPQANGPVMTSGHDPGLGPQQSNGGQGGGGRGAEGLQLGRGDEEPRLQRQEPGDGRDVN